VILDGRFTSTPAGRNAQTAVLANHQIGAARQKFTAAVSFPDQGRIDVAKVM
jgi:hypothetical protein